MCVARHLRPSRTPGLQQRTDDHIEIRAFGEMINHPSLENLSPAINAVLTSSSENCRIAECNKRPKLRARDYVMFLAACPTGGAVHVGWDLRPSSPDIANAVIDAAIRTGQTVIVDGPLPTPALALAALRQCHSAVMITGRHIPADRNGLEF